MKTPPGSVRIGTKLALMVLAMMALTLGAHFYIETHYQRILVELVQNQTEDLSKALEISVQQITSKGHTDQQLLQDYVQRLSARGVSEISILSSDRQVLASSDQAKVGRMVHPFHGSPKHPLVISGTLGDDEEVDQKAATTLDIPIIVDDQKQGYVRLRIILDDFAALLRSIHRKRSLATSLVFLSGVGASLALAYRMTSPLERLSQAAERVSAGDLEVRVEVDRSDEIGRLQLSFQRMLEKLREAKRLEVELRRAERAGAMGRLASAVAHEIRNPLNFLSLSLDHLRSEPRTESEARPEEVRKTLDAMKDELRRVNTMVDDFLSYGRPPRLRIQSCRLEENLGEVVRLATPSAERQRVSLDVAVEGVIPTVMADPEGVRTCLLNLVNNGIQAMPHGGRLRIRVSSGGDGLVRIGVIDEGVGIPSPNLERIFDPYFSTKEAGVGLGLAITQRIVQDHGGRIEVASTEGSGTEFQIFLPLGGPRAGLSSRESPSEREKRTA